MQSSSAETTMVTPLKSLHGPAAYECLPIHCTVPITRRAHAKGCDQIGYWWVSRRVPRAWIACISVVLMRVFSKSLSRYFFYAAVFFSSLFSSFRTVLCQLPIAFCLLLVEWQTLNSQTRVQFIEEHSRISFPNTSLNASPAGLNTSPGGWRSQWTTRATKVNSCMFHKLFKCLYLT